MSKICTSIEQSQKLIELGIDATIADMYYSFDYNIEKYDEDAQIIPKSESRQHFSLFPEDIPAWSLSALIELIPDECRMEKTPLDQTGEFTYSFVDDYYYNIRTYEEGNPVDACYEIILKFLEEKLL